MRWVYRLPLVVFLFVMGAHAAYLSRSTKVSQQVICIFDAQGKCVEDKVVRTASTALSWDGFERYVRQQDYFLGLAYALAFAFAVYALMHWQHSRKQAMAGAAFGVGLGSALWAGTCFLVGCCGSPMLSVWLGLFGAKAIGLTKPLVAALTALSVAGGYVCLRRGCSVDCCGRCEPKEGVTEK